MQPPKAPTPSPSASARPDVSVLIISYNTRDLTLECLRSLFAETTRHTIEVLVVDNCSTDGSAEAIDTEFGSRIHLIKSTTNLGFAGANNEAAKLAKAELLLLLNPDTVVLDGAIDNLLDFAAEQPEARIWGGRTLFPDRSLNPSSCWHKQTLWSLLAQAIGLTSLCRNNPICNPEAYGGWARDTTRRVDIVSGCFLLITRALWEQLDGFHPAFFMYGEEADLCLRAKALGARPMITPEATIIHYGGASEKVRSDKLVRLLKAKVLLIRRHMPRPIRWLALLLFAAWPASRALGLYARKLLKGSKADADSAHAWTAAWQRRHEWLAH